MTGARNARDSQPAVGEAETGTSVAALRFATLQRQRRRATGVLAGNIAALAWYAMQPPGCHGAARMMCEVLLCMPRGFASAGQPMK